MSDTDWARKMVESLRVHYGNGIPPKLIVRLLRRAHAKRDAEWREAIRDMKRFSESDPMFLAGWGAALSDLDAAMKGRKG